MLGLAKSVSKTGLLLSLGLAMAACSHNAKIQPNKPLVQSNQIYYAPAQTYNLDLNTPALVGKLDLQDSCSPEGNSLSITDQIGRFYRVDTVNLNNNPKLPNANTQDIKGLTNQLGQFYAQVYQAQPTAGMRVVRSSLGQSGYMVLEQADQRHIGFLVHQRGDYAYVVQHAQTQFDDVSMQKNLAQLAKNIQVPGRKLKNSESEMALSIDLSSSPQQLAAWKKTAGCS